jgi:glyoxalase family protein
MKPTKGLHHVTAITSQAEKIYPFFSGLLGLRLVKKTINQDDIQTYHLFFADDIGSAGTDMTFFDFPNIGKKVKGTNEISRTSFRVSSDEAVHFWYDRLTSFNVPTSHAFDLFGKKILFFEDFDEQQYAIISDQNDKGKKVGMPYKESHIQKDFAILGLGPVFITVDDIQAMTRILNEVMMFELIDTNDTYHWFETNQGGNGASIILEENKTLPIAQMGYGAVHHVAFRVEDVEELQSWIKHLRQFRAPNSGQVDRFYFKSLYTRLYRGILFEFATDGPGFIDDEESYEMLGKRLALPPKFRQHRKEIESQIRHFDTTLNTIELEKKAVEVMKNETKTKSA